MKATHIDYQRPGCLRIVDAPPRKLFTVGIGWHEATTLCAGPGSPEYIKCFKNGLPKWEGSPEQLAEAEPKPEPEEDTSEDTSK